MSTQSTQKWHKVNRSRFKTAAEFRRWQAERKARYRRKHPLKYSRELERNRGWMRKHVAQLRGLIMFGIIGKIKSSRPPA